MTTPYEEPTVALDVPVSARRHWSWAYLCAWVVGVALVAWGGTQADGYLEHVRKIPPPHPYPTWLVLVIAFALAVELAAFALVLHLGARGPALWREWVAATIAAGFAALAVAGSLHANPAYLDWMLWTLVALVVMATRALVRTLAAVVAAWRRGRQGAAA